MAFNFHKTKRNSFFCDEKVHPVVKEVIKTRARLLGINVAYDNIWEHNFEDTKYCGVIFSYPNIEGRKLSLIPTVPQWVTDMEIEMHPNDIRTIVKVVNIIGQEVDPKTEPKGTVLIYLYNDATVEKKLAQ